MRYISNCVILISIFYLHNLTNAIEPIGTIGHELPQKHVFHTNGKMLRVVQRHIEIVDVDTSEVEDEFGNLTDNSEVAFSPNVSHIAILDSSWTNKTTTVNIWDINAREISSNWEFESDDSYYGAFSPIEPLFAAVSDTSIELWNWQTGEHIGSMKGARRPLKSCYVRANGRTCHGTDQIVTEFTPDGKYLIVASHRPDIELWNIEKRELEGHFEGHIGNWVEGLDISHDGKLMASFDRELGSVYVWDMNTHRLERILQSGIGYITDLEFSPDSQLLYVASRTGVLRGTGNNVYEGWDDKVRVLDVNTFEQIDRFQTEFRHLENISLSPDGSKMHLYYLNGEVMWDIENKRKHYTWADFIWVFSEVGLSPDGKTYTAVSSHFIKTWDVASQQPRLLVSADGNTFQGLAFSPDSRNIVVGKGLNRMLELRNLKNGNIESLIPHHISYVEKISYGTTGRWIAVSDWDELAILDINQPDKPQLLHMHLSFEETTNFSRFGFSNNDEYFAAAARTGINDKYTYWILLWKREGDNYVFQYAWEGYIADKPTFVTNTDRSILFAGMKNEDAQVWKLSPESPQLLNAFTGYYPMKFTKDGRYLLTEKDNNLQIVDWSTGIPIEHPTIDRVMSISEHGSKLVSYDIYGQHKIWDITSILTSLPKPVDPHRKELVTLGQVKRNQLLQNYPNPFNPETWIPFKVADENYVNIEIYKPIGELVRLLSLGKLVAGDYTSQEDAAYWDGLNNDHEPVSSGVYFYTITAGDFSATRKMLVIK